MCTRQDVTAYAAVGKVEVKLQLEKQRAVQLAGAASRLLTEHELAAAQTLDIRGRCGPFYEAFHDQTAGESALVTGEMCCLLILSGGIQAAGGKTPEHPAEAGAEPAPGARSSPLPAMQLQLQLVQQRRRRRRRRQW